VPFFRHLDSGADPRKLLDPQNQVSTPWGSPDHGACDKCTGEGTVHYRCLSCIEEGPSRECPACEGRVEYPGTCPTCAGTSEISDTRRSGVSVFPSLAGLYRYLIEREVELDGSVIVELEGRISDEPDLDADEGALLVLPSQVVTVHPVDRERVDDLRRRLGPPR
jgi:hypothetical protein